MSSKTPPRLACRELAAYAPDRLEAVQAAFREAAGCSLGQGWLPGPEKDFAPATVRVGWRENSLRIFAELLDADIFSRATAPNQRMWELGDAMEIFLQSEVLPGYVELHITPDNLRLQLRFPDLAALQRARAADFFDDLMLADGVFGSRVWKCPAQGRWYVHADIPPVLVSGSATWPPGAAWRFSFSRYDYTRGRPEPVISSSSPHAQPNFHRREEWGTLIFQAKNNL
jgi:hypothetical protein